MAGAENGGSGRAALRALIARDGSRPVIVASVFTPYQLLVLERILGEAGAFDGLVIDQRPEKFRRNRPADVPGAQVIEASLTGSVVQADQRRLLRETLSRIETFVGERRFVFMCASFAWGLNNLVLARFRRRGRARFVMIEDGLSTYIEAGQAAQGRLRNLAREVVRRLKGEPARALYSGHSLGLDLPEVEGIVTGSPDVPHAPGRNFVVLPPAAIDEAAPRDPGAVLFVGQPYLRDYGEGAIRRFAERSAAFLRNRGATRIDFKPHHFQTSGEIGLYLDQGFALYDPPMAVEEVIGASDHRVIASCNTTALITGRILLGGAIEAIAFDPTTFRPAQETRDPADVEALFRRFDVEIVHLS